MNNKTVIILGSSRSFGNTRKIVDEMLQIDSDINLIDLNDYKFSYFDYEFQNASDDFYPLVKQILNYESIVFATPIYWYTMSAQLKTFFDRLSDFLYEDKKILGRQFRGKNMGVLSCGSDQTLFDGFTMPFEQTANYLEMNYKGHLHTWIDTAGISDKTRTDLELFNLKLRNSHPVK